MKKLILLFIFYSNIVSSQTNSIKKNGLLITNTYAGSDEDSISVRIAKIDANLYFLDCVNGFGGGNVAASIGEDGILLVDDMYASMSAKLIAALKTISAKPIRLILNTHFHGDHIQGNKNFRDNTIIIAHENVSKRLIKNNKESNPTAGMMPMVTFTDSLTVNFNGEDIKLIHLPNGHTDGDAVIFFTKSKVLHLGDMFFFEMFPAVYTEGGGNIKQLIINLDKVLLMFPPGTHVIPGHGNLATMQDLENYVKMLKETVGIVESNIKAGKTLEQMKAAKLLAKYDALGAGGAQTTDEYLTMLYKLLSSRGK